MNGIKAVLGSSKKIKTLGKRRKSKNPDWGYWINFPFTLKFPLS